MTFDINQIYKNLLGRPVKEEGKTYWTDQYNQAIANNQSSAQAIANIKNSIAQGDEYDTDQARH